MLVVLFACVGLVVGYSVCVFVLVGAGVCGVLDCLVFGFMV